MVRRGIIAVAAFAALGLDVGDAYAMCQDTGHTITCTINGRKGERWCAGGRITPCIPDGPPPPPPAPTVHGTAFPKYYVLTVLYAPPGTQGGKSTTSVIYGAGSSTGTVTSASKSFKQATEVKVSAKGGFFGSVELGIGFGYNSSNTSSKSLEIKKSVTSQFQVNGPSSDGVDHDHDLIYLWLNPGIDVALTGGVATWTLTQTGTAVIQYAYVGWLKNPATMPAGLVQVLGQHGITAQDFPTILQADPFANGSTTVDPARFQPMNTTFPYEPPLTANDPVPTYAVNLSNAATNTTGSSATDEYKVSLSIKATAGADAGVAALKSTLQDDSSWTWTNTTAGSIAAGTTETATVTVGGPAFGYSGTTDMEVLFDTLYKSFFFRPVESHPSFSGNISAGSAGTHHVLAGQEVVVTANGKRYRTFTNADGEYRVFGTVTGSVTVRAGGVTHTVSHVPVGGRVNLRIARPS